MPTGRWNGEAAPPRRKRKVRRPLPAWLWVGLVAVVAGLVAHLAKRLAEPVDDRGPGSAAAPRREAVERSASWASGEAPEHHGRGGARRGRPGGPPEPRRPPPNARYFAAESGARGRAALALYESVKTLPLVCPHTHVEAAVFLPGFAFGSPAALFLQPDHYVFRMLHSRGIDLDDLGIPHADGLARPVEPRRAWKLLAENWHLFRGTPSSLWMREALREVFDVHTPLRADTADEVYDAVDERLRSPAFTPRGLLDRLNIEVLCTTNAATDPLEAHAALKGTQLEGRVRPTFRPDGVVDLAAPGWRAAVSELGRLSGVEIVDLASYLRALEERRAFFKAMGATATDHGARTPRTARLPADEAANLFARALTDGGAGPEDAARFTAHMLIEFARMSAEDGLVMQLHVGVERNHNPGLFKAFGPDKGGDIPLAAEFTENLRPLLAEWGSDRRLTLILFTLDESAYARELAPLAGHYPALHLGPPWWFHDSREGMRRYLTQVWETAGVRNLAGFNDDTRAFLTIPGRHDLWRRALADWVGELFASHVVDWEDALAMVRDLAYDQARRTYKLDDKPPAAQIRLVKPLVGAA